MTTTLMRHRLHLTTAPINGHLDNNRPVDPYKINCNILYLIRLKMIGYKMSQKSLYHVFLNKNC